MELHSFPIVERYEDLVDLRESSDDMILAAMDVENVDHPGCGTTSKLGKLSEVGIAALDTRKLGGTLDEASFAEVAKAIQARHTVVGKWSHIDKHTCPSNKGWHKKTGTPHIAEPYDCQFAKTKLVATGELAITQASEFLGSMANWNQQGPAGSAGSRYTNVLFWDAHLEMGTFAESHTYSHLKPNHSYHDLQKFQPIKYRWNFTAAKLKSQPGCKDLLQSLGLLDVGGTGVYLHNACNDAVMELLAYCRLLKLSEDEWETWIDGYNLPPVTIPNLFDATALEANRQLGESQTARAKSKAKAFKTLPAPAENKAQETTKPQSQGKRKQRAQNRIYLTF
ncbi:hypothetical protein V8F20_001870 [Naviculisporaceae sp. PSN 640]